MRRRGFLGLFAAAAAAVGVGLKLPARHVVPAMRGGQFNDTTFSYSLTANVDSPLMTQYINKKFIRDLDKPLIFERYK